MFTKPAILLASSSPRRSDILKQFGYTVDSVEHSFNEDSLLIDDFPSPRDYVKEIAKQKAYSVSYHNNTVLLAADTIVVCDHSILGKPKNYQQASCYLSMLQGKAHYVISAFCLRLPFKDRPIIRSSLSTVIFNCLTSHQIDDYINTHKPFDKAGAYGIQECPPYFISSYSGSIYTIMGLPIYILNQTIKDSHQVFVSL